MHLGVRRKFEDDIWLSWSRYVGLVRRVAVVITKSCEDLPYYDGYIFVWVNLLCVVSLSSSLNKGGGMTYILDLKLVRLRDLAKLQKLSLSFI